MSVNSTLYRHLPSRHATRPHIDTHGIQAFISSKHHAGDDGANRQKTKLKLVIKKLDMQNVLNY